LNAGAGADSPDKALKKMSIASVANSANGCLACSWQWYTGSKFRGLSISPACPSGPVLNASKSVAKHLITILKSESLKFESFHDNDEILVYAYSEQHQLKMMLHDEKDFKLDHQTEVTNV
jgi:hypothetical protein